LKITFTYLVKIIYYEKNPFAVAIVLLAFIFNASAKQIQVNILNYEFSPKSFTASQGDTVHFVWVAGFHTTTSTSVPSGALTWDKRY
jgi:plastocyanin